MLTRRSARRAGFTLAELVVALCVGGVTFGAFALVVTQQERTHAELARRLRARSQLQDGLTALAGDLRAVSPTAGDLAVGEARDSSVAFRATVGTAVTCDVRGQTVVTSLASFVAAPQPGDTAWAYVERDAAHAWIPVPVTGVSLLDRAASPGCSFPADALPTPDAGLGARPRYALAVPEQLAAHLPAGAPLRVTRPVRYSLYRAPDGRWYLGRREWSAAWNRFETIQPVSGPYRGYAPAASAASGLELRYFDRDAVELSPGSPEVDRVAAVVAVLRAAPPRWDRVVEARDVATVTVAFQDRR